MSDKVLNKIFVAIDDMTLEEASQFINTHPEIKLVKIGLELFLKYGKNILDIKRNNQSLKIFLDLKLHDIPQTVSHSIRSLEGLPIDFLTIHLSGGRDMCFEATKARDKYLPNTKIVGVSILTSINDSVFKEMFNQNLDDELFLRLFKMANETKIDAIVSSALETRILKNNFPMILSITPGIRLDSEIKANQNLGDQKRVISPKDAFQFGSDYLVMGRSITKAKDLKLVLEELKNL